MRLLVLNNAKLFILFSYIILHLSDGCHCNHTTSETKTNRSIAVQHNDNDNSTETKLKRDLKLTRTVVQRILVPIVTTFGVIANIINILVLSQKVMRTSSTNIYLTGLAICDVLYLILVFSLTFKHYSSIAHTKEFNFYKFHLGKALADVFSNTGVWLTLTFTIERYIGVCYPMKGRIWCTPQRAKIITIMVCILVTIITFPEFFESKIAKVITDDKNKTIWRGVSTSFGSSKSYQIGYRNMTQALFTFIPLILLCLFNTFLIRAVYKSRKQRRTMTQISTNHKDDRHDRQTKEQQKITIMLIIVVLVFLFCQAPQACLNIYYSFCMVNDVPSSTIELLTIFSNVANLLVQINASINFILYSSFSTRYRRVFKRVFCKCLGKIVRQEALYSEYYKCNKNLTCGSNVNLQTTCGEFKMKSHESINRLEGQLINGSNKMRTPLINSRTNLHTVEKNGYAGTFV